MLLRLLHWVLVLGAVVATSSSIFVAWREPARLRGIPFWAMLAAFVALVPIRYLPLPHRLRASVFVLVIAVVGVMAAAVFGLSPGPVLVCTLATVSAGIFLGRRAMVLSLVGTTAAFLLLGYLVTRGQLLVSGWPHQMDFAVWARSTFAYGFAGGCVAALVYFTVRRIEDQEAALGRVRRIEAVAHLAGGVAHDFNNYLQVILSWTEVLLSRATDPDARAALQEMEASTHQAADLTRQLLELGRRGVYSPRFLSVSAELRDLSVSFTRMLPEDIHLEADVRDTPGTRCDAAQLRQIVLNLLINARDALGSGGTIKLEVAPATRLPAGASSRSASHVRYIRISIRDNGPGIPEQIREHIFEPFFTTKGDSGTGLGLAIVYGAVKANHGFIDLETEEGRGTAFHVFLPVVAADRTEEATHTREAPDRAHIPRDEPIRVLLAEDDSILRTRIALFLEEAGVQVVTAANGDEALRLAGRVKADVLVADGVMPGAPTSEAIKTFVQRNPNGRVLVCSGHVPEELRRRDLASGAFELLAKPFSLHTLLERINELARPSR